MFARHDLVWLTEAGWQRAHATVPPDYTRDIDAWGAAGWPAVVRRADAGLTQDQLSIGIALPPDPTDGNKKRIACVAQASDVYKVSPPLQLSHVLETVPAAWRAQLATLNREAREHGLAIGVYGSVALQALTGRRYLTGASDLDLLLHPATHAQLAHALDLLDTHARRLPLDGEIVFPDAQAVAWKELSSVLHADWLTLGRSGGTRVLVKGIHGVSLKTASGLLATMHRQS